MKVVGVPVKYLTTPSDKTNSDITHFVYNLLKNDEYSIYFL